jgi:co-chaperonin GroES (HSP10)
MSIVAAVSAEERQEIVARLIRILDSTTATAEEQLTAQEQLDVFAREITDWFKPAGYKLLLYIPYLQAKLESQVYQSDKSRDEYQSAAIHAYVIAMGSEAYSDKQRFPNGPWCRVGDRVMFRAYSGTRFQRVGYKFLYALVNDDTIDAVMQGTQQVERPRF